MGDNFTPKNANNYYCKTCDFICSKQCDWLRHTMTLKHKNGDTMVTTGDIFTQKNAKSEYVCECGNTYKYRQGISRHRKTCFIHPGTSVIQSDKMTPTFEVDKEMLIKLLLKNQDVMEKMIELMPQIGNNNYSHNTNSNNQFNIQMFLNDHCKNAMNLTDFIESLPITADTYDSTIENGLTKTLTNMITNGLSQLDILERPIHCTDATRKTLYVKEANTWEKDTELIRMLLGIKTLARKQRIMINKWQDANEGWETDDYIQTKLTTLIGHSMTNIESDEKETSKIIRSVSKNVYLDNETKQQYLHP
jgi:hypothetical protein